jgi:hypothetical protein
VTNASNALSGSDNHVAVIVVEEKPHKPHRNSYEPPPSILKKSGLKGETKEAKGQEGAKVDSHSEESHVGSSEYIPVEVDDSIAIEIKEEEESEVERKESAGGTSVVSSPSSAILKKKKKSLNKR